MSQLEYYCVISLESRRKVRKTFADLLLFGSGLIASDDHQPPLYCVKIGSFKAELQSFDMNLSRFKFWAVATMETPSWEERATEDSYGWAVSVEHN